MKRTVPAVLPLAVSAAHPVRAAAHGTPARPTHRSSARRSSGHCARPRPRFRPGFRRGQRPRRRDGPRLRLGFWRGQRLRPGCRRFRPWPGRRPRRRPRMRRPRPWRRVRVRDRRWLRWSGQCRFRRHGLRRGGIAGCFADGHYGHAGGLCWHLEMIPRRVPTTRPAVKALAGGNRAGRGAGRSSPPSRSAPASGRSAPSGTARHVPLPRGPTGWTRRPLALSWTVSGDGTRG